MHAGKNFTLKEAILWTRRDIYLYVLIATLTTVIYEILDLKFISIPWLPMALIGTAVAFLIGFKNNATYDRLWEARKVWGAIVNSSRTWGIMARDFVTAKHTDGSISEEEIKAVHKRLIYRHVAWLTALRFQLRQPKKWEYLDKKANAEFRHLYKIPELETKIEDEIRPYLNDEDYDYVLSKKNRATHVIAKQSEDLKELLDKGLIEDFRHMEMENVLKDFYTQQGKSERIKNFPYPRQFATLNLYFVWLFVILLPFGMLQEFDKMGEWGVWLTIPFSTLVSWVFHTMEKIGEATENPFQGGANDVPVTNMSRTIEIDLREMLDETDLPEPITPDNNILM